VTIELSRRDVRIEAGSFEGLVVSFGRVAAQSAQDDHRAAGRCAEREAGRPRHGSPHLLTVR